jgi:hypothetical protein
VLDNKKDRSTMTYTNNARGVNVNNHTRSKGNILINALLAFHAQTTAHEFGKTHQTASNGL